MKLRISHFLLASALTLMLSPSLVAQKGAPVNKDMPHPAAQQAPGAAANKVWVNTASNVYHCPGDRYYGKTKAGKYMTEPEAKAAHAHGEKGKDCFK